MVYVGPMALSDEELMAEIKRMLASPPRTRVHPTFGFGSLLADQLRFAVDVEEFFLQARALGLCEKAGEILEEEIEAASRYGIPQSGTVSRARNRLLKKALSVTPAPARA